MYTINKNIFFKIYDNFFAGMVFYKSYSEDEIVFKFGRKNNEDKALDVLTKNNIEWKKL